MNTQSANDEDFLKWLKIRKMKRNPQALADIRADVRNAVLWLAGKGGR
jgi:hypothetical protein